MDRTEAVDMIWEAVLKYLPNVFDETDSDKTQPFYSDGDYIYSKHESEIDALADFFDTLYGDKMVFTRIYNHDFDGATDERIGLYYMGIR